MTMKQFFISLMLLLFLGVGKAEVINVADHGIQPGKDVTLEVNHLIESLKGKKGITLFFPKGEYIFYPENAVESYRRVSNHENSMKRMAFPLFEFENLTLDGNGSTFIFHGRICPIIIDGSKGTILKNFSIDWDTPFHHELRVVERDEEANSFVAEISPMKYGFEIKNDQILLNHYNWQDPIAQNITFDPKTAAPIWNTRLYHLSVRNNTKVTKVGDNLAKFQQASKVPPPVGSIIATYGQVFNNRLAQAIHIINASDTYVENVTVFAAGGMALIAERSENVYLNGFVVTSTEERYMATRADATHFVGCKGLIKVENCRMEHMLDDAINVHGAYIKVEKYMGENVFLCEISHRQQGGFTFAEAGDKVMITSRETVSPIFETTVKQVKVLNEKRLLLTVSELPERLPEGLLSLENMSWYPDLVMKKNIIRQNRARGALISTKGKVLIEDNYISSQMHGILIEGDNNKWYESGGVTDVVIKNNTFENISFGLVVGYPLYISPMLRPEQRLGDEKYHQNIKFINNTVNTFNGHVVYARSVKGLEVKGNRINLSKDYPTGSTLPSIALDYCEQIDIKRNKYTGFDWPMKVESSNKTTGVNQKNNKGLSVGK